MLSTCVQDSSPSSLRRLRGPIELEIQKCQGLSGEILRYSSWDGYGTGPMFAVSMGGNYVWTLKTALANKLRKTMLRPTFIIIVLSLLTVLLYPPQGTGNFYSESEQARILVLTAHPDDECLFFGPTILGLDKKNTLIYALSLSTGNADGIGTIRSQEFHNSYEVLGVPHERRWIVDNPYVC